MKKALGTILLLNTFTLAACSKDDMERPDPIVTIIVEGYDEPIVLELYYHHAPNTVNNFIHLIQNEYYNGVVFHRIIENFMIQGGQGAPLNCRIQGEFTENEFENSLLHERGVISMARTNDPDSATGQFFITHQARPDLDGNYAAFGKMVAGFATLDAIAGVAKDLNDRPLVDVVITSITVDTGGFTYKAPICLGY